MGNPAFVTTGRVHGPTRKVGKIGSEHITFSVTTNDIDSWYALIKVCGDGDCVISIEGQQGELLDGSEIAGGKKKGRGAKAHGDGDAAQA